MYGIGVNQEKARDGRDVNRYNARKRPVRHRVTRPLKLYLVPIRELAESGFGSPGRRKRIARSMRPLRRRTTRATIPAD
jgi:hypothetical protein